MSHPNVQRRPKFPIALIMVMLAPCFVVADDMNSEADLRPQLPDMGHNMRLFQLQLVSEYCSKPATQSQMGKSHQSCAQFVSKNFAAQCTAKLHRKMPRANPQVAAKPGEEDRLGYRAFKAAYLECLEASYQEY